jgi:hypothetical protein
MRISLHDEGADIQRASSDFPKAVQVTSDGNDSYQFQFQGM